MIGRYLSIVFSSGKEKELRRFVMQHFGIRIANISLYRQALKHSSSSFRKAEKANEQVQTSQTRIQQTSLKVSNERLEFLGDAVLGTAVSAFFYREYPDMDEGELTEARAKLVSRKRLNELALQIHIEKVLESDEKNPLKQTSISGNALEALIGAIYLDKGFEQAANAAVNLLKHSFDIEKLVQTSENFKSKILEWAQKNRKKAEFRLAKADGPPHQRTFHVVLYLEDQIISSGTGFSIKVAEQRAAEEACATHPEF